jgi:NADH:ubiquinone oxidoreductase subunit 6 (subunit J)
VSQTLFLIFSAIGLLAAVGTILARNLVHAALYLVSFFFIVACQFVMLEAEFLAAIQVLVYIGAVAILLMFGIMLTRNIQGDDTTTIRSPLATLPAVVVGLVLFLALGFGIRGRITNENQTESPWKATYRREPARATAGTPTSARSLAINNMGKAVGVEMMTRYAIAFEVAGLLLTAALVGAIALAYREGDDEPLRLRERAAALPLGGAEPGNGQAAHDGSSTEAFSTPSR